MRLYSSLSCATLRRAIPLAGVALAISLLSVAPAAGQPLFTEVGVDLGLSEEQYGTDNSHGLGVTWIDFNDDGWHDLLLVNGIGRSHHLWENLGDGTFGNADHLLPPLPDNDKMGALYADYDNDGDEDVYIFLDHEIKRSTDENPTDGPANLLLKNLWVESGGTAVPLFEEVAAGVEDMPAVPFGPDYPGYRSPTGSWVDYDRDGWIDLYVGHWTTRNPGHDGSQNKLYRNNGDGTFSDVTAAAGLPTLPPGPEELRSTLAAIAGHLDGDLWPDLYDGNMEDPPPYLDDYFYRNDGDGTFTESTGDSPGMGDDTFADMGITIGDPDLDGDWDFYISDMYDTTLDQPPLGNAYYVGNGDGTFSDNMAVEAGIEADASWGVSFFDVDHDGLEDLFVTTMSGERDNFLYMNDGDGTFTDVAASAGVAVSGDGRGTALADYDGDGDLDLGVIHDGGRFRLFRNDTPSTGSWLQVGLEGVRSNRSAIGAVVEVTADGVTHRRQVLGGESAHSQNQAPRHFGLGSATTAEQVVVRWPSGAVNTYADVAVDQTIELVERFVPGVGHWRPEGAQFILRHGLADGPVDSAFFVTVPAGNWVPVAGDWDGDGLASVGLVDVDSGDVLLWNGDGGAADLSYNLPIGAMSAQPIAGDWDGDGVDGLGAALPTVPEFQLWNDHDGGAADMVVPVIPANLEWRALAGDWDGDGVDTLGRYAPEKGAFILTNTVGSADAELIYGFGPKAATEAVPISGDWTGDGVDTVGLYRPSTITFHLRFSHTQGPPDLTFRFGSQNRIQEPVVGLWAWPTP